MKKEYDFSKGVRGRFHRPNKIQKTVRFDADVIQFFMEMAEREGIPYQTLINLTLRKFALEGGEILIEARPKRKAAAS
jgi:uncharacterized protein (DUF4415 family)